MFRLSDTLAAMPAIQQKLASPLEAIIHDLNERGWNFLPVSIDPEDFSVYSECQEYRIWSWVDEPHIIHAKDGVLRTTIELADPNSIHHLYVFLGVENSQQPTQQDKKEGEGT